MNSASNVTFNYRGQHVLVTGASRGIGYAVAEGFCAAGATLSILADDDGVFEAAESLTSKYNVNVTPVQCDITFSEPLNEELGKMRKVDVLVNNAGLERITPVLDDSPKAIELFRRVIDVNVMGSYHVTRCVLPRMSAASRIIMTCSIWSRTSVAEFSAYCSSKHANLGFMRALAAELAPQGIRVNGVCPGWVRTDAAMRSLKDMSLRSGRDESELLKDIIDNQLLDGLMESHDVVGAYLFLASNAAASITGQTITVDRGEIMT